MKRFSLTLTLVVLLVTITNSASLAHSPSLQLGLPGTEYVTFWSGDLRIFALRDNTEVTIIDIGTGLPLAFEDDLRVSSTNFPTNPFVLPQEGDSFEGIGGRGGPDDEIQIRIIASDATGGSEHKPVIVWTGSLAPITRHPDSPPSLAEERTPWMSYIPAFSETACSSGRELGREFLGFTTKEMYIFAVKEPWPTEVVIEDLVTNTDADSDDSQALGTLGPIIPVYTDAEIEIYFLNEFEDDTVRVRGNVDMSVLVGWNSKVAPDWAITPPSYAARDHGLEPGTLFYTFVNRDLTVFPLEDDTTVIITDLSDGDDSTTITLANGDTEGDYDLYTPVLDSFLGGNILPRPDSPVVNIISNSENSFDNDFVKIESNKSILVYVGPAGCNYREFADVAFPVPTGPHSRIFYTYAQNHGGSNDLQIFGFIGSTVVTITSLSRTDRFMDPVWHDFVIGPGIGGPNGWLTGTVGSDVWWGSDVWSAEMLRVESNKPVVVINGDYDSPYFGTFLPFGAENLCSADLSITKTDSPDPVKVGDNLTYTIEVVNNGPDVATDVTLTDVLPTGVTFVSSRPGAPTCKETSGTVTCNLNSIASSASVTVGITTTVVAFTAAGAITNTVSVGANEIDPNPSDNTATEDTTLERHAVYLPYIAKRSTSTQTPPGTPPPDAPGELPEPFTLLLMGGGLAALMGYARRRGLARGRCGLEHND